MARQHDIVEGFREHDYHKHGHAVPLQDEPVNPFAHVTFPDPLDRRMWPGVAVLIIIGALLFVGGLTILLVLRALTPIFS